MTHVRRPPGRQVPTLSGVRTYGEEIGGPCWPHQLSPDGELINGEGDEKHAQ